MNTDISYLDGKSICVVYCRQKDDNKDSNKLEISTMQGVAKIINNTLLVDIGHGNPIAMPQSSYKNIHPNDGTAILKKAQYFIMVKVQGKLQ